MSKPVRSVTVDNNFPVFIGRARAAAKHAASDGQRALDAIIYSAIALEAFTHDLICVLQMSYEFDLIHLPPPLVAVCRVLPDLEEQRVQTATKYQVLYHLLSGNTFDPAIPPFKDFDFLFKLRNHIVHPKCELITQSAASEPYERATRKILAGLRERRLTQHNHRSRRPWKMDLENPLTAEWAVAVAKSMVNAICDAIPESNFKQQWPEQIRSANSSMNREL